MIESKATTIYSDVAASCFKLRCGWHEPRRFTHRYIERAKERERERDVCEGNKVGRGGGHASHQHIHARACMNVLRVTGVTMSRFRLRDQVRARRSVAALSLSLGYPSSAMCALHAPFFARTHSRECGSVGGSLTPVDRVGESACYL